MSLSETERLFADYEQAKHEALRAEQAAHQALRDAIDSKLVHETGDILAPEGAIFANHIHEGLVALEDVVSGAVTKASDFLKSEEPAVDDDEAAAKAEAERLAAEAKAEEERVAAEAEAKAKEAEEAAKAEAEKLAKEAEEAAAKELEQVDADAAPAGEPKKVKKA